MDPLVRFFIIQKLAEVIHVLCDKSSDGVDSCCVYLTSC